MDGVGKKRTNTAFVVVVVDYYILQHPTKSIHAHLQSEERQTSVKIKYKFY